MPKPVQRYANVVVSAVAHVDAPHVVTSQSIEDVLAPAMERLGITPGVLEGVAGISERRFYDADVQPSAAAAEAGELALDAWGGRREDIGALVSTSVCRDYVEPATAAFVHADLGLSPGAMNFDLANACLGFLNGMSVVAAMIELGEIDHGIVVDGETSRFTTERTVARLSDPACDEATFRDSFASLTLGSGAAAMVLSRADLAEGGHPYRGAVSRAATEHNRLCVGQYDDMRTDTRGLLLAGMAHMKDVYPEAAELLGLSDDDVATYVIHQISLVHTTMFAEMLGMAIDKIPLLFPRFGNVGPASIPITLSKEAEAGRLVTGDRVALIGIGSGLNAAVGELVW